MAATISTTRTEELDCVLNEAEVAARAVKLAETLRERDALKEERKAVLAEARTLLTENAKAIRALSFQITAKIEKRAITVEDRLNFDEQRVESVRLDTGEIINWRAMTPEEQQLALPITGAPKRRRLTLGKGKAAAANDAASDDSMNPPEQNPQAEDEDGGEA